MRSTQPLIPLWDFALSYYAEPQVADTCVQLQDQYGANVCLLIGLHWLDSRGQILSELEILALAAHIQPWAQTIVEHLRNVRRELRLSVGCFIQDETQIQLRALVKQAELLAEKKILIEIERWVTNKLPLASVLSPQNLVRYLISLQVPNNLITRLQIKT